MRSRWQWPRWSASMHQRSATLGSFCRRPRPPAFCISATRSQSGSRLCRRRSVRASRPRSRPRCPPFRSSPRCSVGCRWYRRSRTSWPCRCFRPSCWPGLPPPGSAWCPASSRSCLPFSRTLSRSCCGWSSRPPRACPLRRSPFPMVRSPASATVRRSDWRSSSARRPPHGSREPSAGGSDSRVVRAFA